MEPERIFAPPNDPASHSPAYKIFHYKFKCSMQPIHMYSEKVLQEGGIPSSGIREIDRTSMQTFVPCYMTIAAMAEYADEGVPFRLANSNDAVKIAQIIQAHMDAKLREAHYDINMVKVPIDDLRKLDGLAEKIHPISAGILKKRSPQEHEFFQRLRAFGGRGTLSRLRQSAPKEQAPAEQPTGYRSAMPRLEEAVAVRNKPWMKGRE